MHNVYNNISYINVIIRCNIENNTYNNANKLFAEKPAAHPRAP